MNAVLWRRLKVAAAWFATALFVLIGVAVAIGFRAFGQSASGARLARMQRSPQWRDGHFVNPEPLVTDWIGSLTGALHISPAATPEGKIQSVRLDPKTLRTQPDSGLRVTWLGHASTLVEIDGARVLTDPMWSERSSPIPFVGLRRYYAPPIALSDLPRIHAVVISHDHYDHLDYRTLLAMKDWKTTFVVPLGVGPSMDHDRDRPIPCDLARLAHRAGTRRGGPRSIAVRVFLPVHWALLTLAYHGWSEPMERVLAAAGKRNVTVLTPRPYAPVEPEGPILSARWWPTLPWQTAEQSPLVSFGALKPH